MQKQRLRRSISARERPPMIDVRVASPFLAVSKSSRSAKALVQHAQALQRVSQDSDARHESTDGGAAYISQNPVPPPEQPAGAMVDLVVDEICSTEATYVKNLGILVESFVKPLQDDKHDMMANTAVAVFFSTLEELVKLNSTFLEELMQVTIQEEPGHDATERIGVLFNQFIPLFTSFYSDYAKFFDDFTPLLRDFKTQSKRLSTFLDQCQRKCNSSQSFESLLILPIQRIPRYNLLLKRVVEHTQSGHPYLASLRQTVHAMGEAAQRMDETLRQKEQTEIVLSIQAQFAGQVSLFALNRRFVRSGMLVKMSTKRKDKVMVHMFNDMLLYSDVVSADTFHARRVVDFRSSACRVDETVPSSYVNLFGADALECGFMMISAEKSFVLFAATVQDKQAWVSAIGSLIAHTQATTTSPAVDNAAAVVWIPDSVAEECSQCGKPFRLLWRRHHCRRCGFVVCGHCSEHRSILFDNDPRPVRVCTTCHNVLTKVKECALLWLGCVIEFKKRKLLRRDRKNKWSDYEFDIKGGILRQYHGGMVVKTLNLSGAIVVRRRDQRSLYCFQISTTFDVITTNVPPPPASSGFKMSPLKPKRFDKAGMGTSTSTTSTSTSSRWDDQEWLLCAYSNDELVEWTHAIEESANKALKRTSTVRSRSVDGDDPDAGRGLEHQSGSIDLDQLDYLVYDDEKAERYRHQILTEIVRSEQSYVECLGTCIRMFVQPLMLREVERKRSVEHNSKLSLQRRFSQMSLKKHEQIKKTFTLMGLNRRANVPNGLLSTVIQDSCTKKTLLDADMSIFFTSMGQIYTLNQQFLEHLTRHLKETEIGGTTTIHRVGAIFNAYAPLFQMYSSYARYHETALAAIESERFMVMLSEIQMPMDETTMHQLRTFLNMPIERIPQYSLYLHDLKRWTTDGHMDHAPLLSSITAVNRVVLMLQDTIDARDSLRNLRQVELKYGLPPDKDRQFVKEGRLQKVCRHAVKVYHVVLFNNALLYAPTGWKAMYVRKHKIIDLKGCSVSAVDSLTDSVRNALSPNITHNNALQFLSSQKSFLLIADSPTDQIEWLAAIHDAIVRVEMSARLSISSVDDEDAHNNDAEFVIKSGWLPVKRGHKWKRMWVTVDYQHVSLATSFQAPPDVQLLIAGCDVEYIADSASCFQVTGEDMLEDNDVGALTKEFTLDALHDRDEWIRAIDHCVRCMHSGGDMMSTSAVSEPNSGYAPIYMFGAAKNCTLCFEKFALIRTRHHCKRCGNQVCGKCSKSKMVLATGSTKPERVCDKCMNVQRNCVLPPNL
ncbi:hypothetical protein, variant 1 [Aphanomyces astaci]|uniref:FYVE, RhoGEF and PH domain-containing protein 6 n=1 Tax=Aphanomyces astaci TaxID=112090 RepID=W4GMN8_APHAT|nr:hypothetical protein, variant 1 [Aphanomyces astaci]ETV80606.1 hypothetical protein, variant 1 [Aphanomyces astaci]|eukprot:XP_009829553.1 hypothetical protein, variant 1 [Aphanomyces astaci]